MKNKIWFYINFFLYAQLFFATAFCDESLAEKALLYLEGQQEYKLVYAHEHLKKETDISLQDLLRDMYPVYITHGISDFGYPYHAPGQTDSGLPFIQHHFSVIYNDVVISIVKGPSKDIPYGRSVGYKVPEDIKSFYDYVLLFISTNKKAYCGYRFPFSRSSMQIDSVVVIKEMLDIAREDGRFPKCQYAKSKAQSR